MTRPDKTVVVAVVVVVVVVVGVVSLVNSERTARKLTASTTGIQGSALLDKLTSFFVLSSTNNLLSRKYVLRGSRIL